MRKRLVSSRDNRESGQTLVVVTLSLIALIGFLALAIDVGVLYSWRRNLQNAADAGALAGAGEICRGNPGSAISVAEAYAIENRADSATAIREGENLNIVRVTATADVSLFFARVLGIAESGVTAEAAAVCGGVSRAGHIWPVALHDSLLEGKTCGDRIIIIDSNKQCGVDMDCDIDDDGHDDISSGGDKNSLGGSRGWLLFNVSNSMMPEYCDTFPENCGNQPEYFLENALCVLPELPICIQGEPGLVNKFFSTADDVAKDNDPFYAYIPIFHKASDKGAVCPDGYDVFGDLSCSKQWRYLIYDFKCVRVTGLLTDSQKAAIGLDKNVRALEAIIECDINNCFSSLGSSGGGTFEPTGLSAVSLIE